MKETKEKFEKELTKLIRKYAKTCPGLTIEVKRAYSEFDQWNDNKLYVFVKTEFQIK